MIQVWHFGNIILGAPIGSVLFQVVNAIIAGAVFYMVFRKSSWLIVPMILHTLVDFSGLKRGAEVDSWRNNLAYLNVAWPVIYLILLVAARKYINVKQNGA